MPAIGVAYYDIARACTTARAAPYKPRPLDYRRDDQAQEQLRSRIRATVDGLVAMNYDLQRVKWGFVDEVAVQLHTNNRTGEPARFWSFEPSLSRPVNANPGSQKYLGFYGLNAQSHLVALADGCADSIKLALEEVKLEQTDCSALVVILDNASSHKALESWGWERRIFFVWLPAYSPDLNPIEKVWKSAKRSVTQTPEVLTITKLRETFQQGFERLKDKLSFLTSWWENYKPQLSCYSLIFDSNMFQ